jgi:hypothetical protein
VFRKLIKKIGKGISKVAKKIVKVQKKVWKGIKKVGGKVMKAINKAGVLGQIGLMLIMPYAMAGVGSLIGSAAGGLSATWTGFGNWASSMMGSSNVFAKTVGHIARGVYHAGATAGKVITGVTKFIDTGFKAIANATGLPNPIEGFSNAVQSGYTSSFEATNNFLFGGTKIGATPEQLASAGVKPTTPITTSRDILGTKSGFDEQGFNIEAMESLGKTTGQAFQPVGSVTYNEASGTYSDILGNEFTADLNGKFTPVNTFKAGEINLQAGEGLEAGIQYDPSVANQDTLVKVKNEPSKLEKLGEKVKDYVDDKAGEYAKNWADSKLQKAIYGDPDVGQSIGFHNWKEVGTTIDVRTFFEQGDNYTPNLVAFYDEAENAFNTPAVGRV